MEEVGVLPRMGLAGRRDLVDRPRPNLFEVESWGVNIPDMDRAVAAILERLARPAPFLVCTLNLDHLVKLRRDEAFRAAYAQAEIVTADGFPIVIAGRWQGAAVTRTTGADLIDPLCREAARRGVPVFLFGSTPEVLFRSARTLHGRYPGLDIRGVASPPGGFRPDSPEADAVIEQLDASGARLCFVALGAPKQELFAAYAMRRLSGVGFIGVGGGLDFIARVQRRAPLLVQKLNLEWFWRLLSDPRRMARRYWECGLLFLEIAPRLALRRTAADQARAR